jgi:O-succinylhomoserine sulfhydrylase
VSPGDDTLAVRGGLRRTEFDETAEALFLTSGYVYGSAAEAEAAFAGQQDRYIYSRYGNPTVAMFEERMRLLEGAEAAFATASGMADVFNALAATVRSGDRVVAARGLFGSCFIILDELLPRWDVTTEFVDGTDLDAWEAALDDPTTTVFLESPSNPMQELVDIAAVAELAHGAGATVIVDNVFATPVLQKPLDLGADVVVYSATKHIDGQGRTLGGVILGSEEFITSTLQPLMRHTGPAMSPFNAWVLLKGVETLQSHPGVVSVRYPFLASHPQHDLARRQMSAGGTVVTFEVAGGRPEAFRVIDALQIVDISNNLGDTKSLVRPRGSRRHRHRRPGRARRLAAAPSDLRHSGRDLDSAARDDGGGLGTAPSVDRAELMPQFDA